MPPRPRLLLADDHVPLLESVRHLLTPAFDIVGVARDGREALELAARVRPDVVVLDVTMPELNGFQTVGRLLQECPGTKVVFLTMHGEDDFVIEAITAGAHGYVLKSRIHLDLIGAINHALAGRLFVPSLTSLSTVAANGHVVQFHTNDDDYLDDVSDLIAATLRSGEQVALLTSKAHGIAVSERLQAGQVNVALLAERGQYLAQDSALAVSQVLVNGRIDRSRLAQAIEGLDQFRLAGPKGPRGRLTVVGDLSGSLYRNGQVEPACDLERIWNELTGPLPFFTVCGYAAHCFDPSGACDNLANVCAAHTAVTSGMFAPRSLNIS
jgi:DNA-binding NarL/FixJ family response regulator